jgi:hypothetical protein
MKPTSDYQRKREHLQLIQGEFRRLAVQYPPLYHERFLSSILTVTWESWQAFTDAYPSSHLWEHWHGPLDGRWIGRFFGDDEGFREFQGLSESLSEIFGQIRFDSAKTDWLDILHCMGALFPSPLLRVITRTWNWYWADHLGEKADTRESPEPHLNMLNLNRVKAIYYPRHPFHEVLSSSVFTSSIAAIQIMLEPEIAVPAMPEFTDLPLVLSPPEPEQLTVKTEDAIFLTAEGTLPQYLFKEVPQGWLLRFAPSGSKPEQLFFGNLKGLHHYQKLLSSFDKRLTVWEIEGLPAPAALPGSTITADEYLEQFGEDEDFRGFQMEGVSHQGRIDDEELAELKAYASSLLRQIQNEPPLELMKELKKDLRQTTRRVRTRRTEIAKENGTYTVFNRVKQAMYECRELLKQNHMYLLHDHLHDSVNAENWGYAYRPRQELLWVF